MHPVTDSFVNFYVVDEQDKLKIQNIYAICTSNVQILIHLTAEKHFKVAFMMLILP